MPHADDASCGAAGRPCEDDEPSVEPAGGDEARLAIVLAVIHASEVRPGRHFAGAQHVEAAIVQGLGAFDSVASDSHALT